MKKEIPFHSSLLDLAVDTISKSDIQKLIHWLRQYPRLTMAQETRKFEHAWSQWLGVKYTVLCNSGSSANLLMFGALDAAGRAGNRRAIVPATGWVTTITPAIQLGYEPSMCESDIRTFGVDPEALEKLLRQTRAKTVIVVHVLGVPCDMPAILRLQKKYGFALLEDCCGSHGSTHGGQKVGTFGDMSSFSF